MLLGKHFPLKSAGNEVEEYKAAPISTGMSAFTPCGDNICESDSEQYLSDEEQDNDNTTKVVPMQTLSKGRTS
jgi:hypothetical protein